ncbi:MAG: cysteine desulfurase family protein [Eubacteriales bacterium]|nr:cysteine desulfurase family protein [Eubacteriales bacterium]
MKIYLDNAATTQPLIDKTLVSHIKTAWYNPSAAYAPAEAVFLEMKKTRQALCDVTGFDGGCIFTSGGTEANNMAILSAYKKGAHYITSAIEHPCVYETFRYLETMGAQVDYVRPNGFCIEAEDVAALVRSDTALVSIMHVNNETGAQNDIHAICGAVKAKNQNAAFHSDGVQALFKTGIDLSKSGVDYYTVSAHKIHALKGTGALLYSNNKAPIRLHFGGDQEYALRPGTENTLGIQAFYEALERGRDGFSAALEIVNGLHKKLLEGLSAIDGAEVNLPDIKVPHIVSVSFPGVRAEVLVRALGEKGIYIGTGAACSRGKLSRVLTACGVGKSSAKGAVRISLSALNTAHELAVCLEEIGYEVKKLRRFGRR